MELSTSQQPKTDFSRTCVISNINIDLIITHKQGICFNCKKNKEIYLISERSLTQEIRKYCLNCAINSLNRLEQGDYGIKDKQVIQEILQELNRKEVEIYNEKVYQRAGTREEARFYTFPDGKKIVRIKCGCNPVNDFYGWCLDNCEYFISWRNKQRSAELDGMK